MSVTITCQHTGIEFEAKSKRSKNHPRVAELLAEANHDRMYSQAVELLAECREAGMSDIDEIIEAVEAGMKLCKTQRNKRTDEWKAWRKQLEAERAKARREWVHDDNVENDVTIDEASYSVVNHHDEESIAGLR